LRPKDLNRDILRESTAEMPRRRHITDIHNSSYSFKGFIFLSDAHSDAETVRNGIQRVDVAPGAVDVGRASAQSGAARQFHYLRGEHQLYRGALRRATVTSGSLFSRRTRPLLVGLPREARRRRTCLARSWMTPIKVSPAEKSLAMSQLAMP
jgi:hypothetical protein